MSVLQSTFYEELPLRDRYNQPDGTFTHVCLHVARNGGDGICIELESGKQYVEANLTIEEAREVLAGLQEAIVNAERSRERWTLS